MGCVPQPAVTGQGGERGEPEEREAEEAVDLGGRGRKKRIQIAEVSRVLVDVLLEGRLPLQSTLSSSRSRTCHQEAVDH
jgi:hypothetical protein